MSRKRTDRWSLQQRVLRLEGYVRFLHKCRDLRRESVKIGYSRAIDDHIAAVDKALRDLIAIRESPEENKWDAKAIARLDEIYRIAGIKR